MILPTLNWIWGRPQALIQRMHFWSPCFGLVKGTNRTPSHDSRYLLSELEVRHAQCFTGIFSSFTSILPSFPRFQCTPNKSGPTLRYTRKYWPSAVPWISEDRLLSPRHLMLSVGNHALEWHVTWRGKLPVSSRLVIWTKLRLGIA